MKLEFKPKSGVKHKVVLIEGHHRLIRPGDRIDLNEPGAYALLATGDWKECKAFRPASTTKGPEIIESISDSKEL